ncbi:MAG: hypothetical protein M1827_003208 [Pycnora praestabilis]|nr:MAG: hypothetical protein M1827_003208 [Pycnora praestabilis]
MAKKKKNSPDHPQPAWLFPSDEANPVLNPKPESKEQKQIDKKRAQDFLKRKAYNTPVKPAPPSQLLNLVAIFMTEWGFNSTARIFNTERQGRSKLNGWEDESGGKLEKGLPKLVKIYTEWYKAWDERKNLDMTSSDEGDDAIAKREKMAKKKEKLERIKQKAQEDGTSSSGSEESSDVGSDVDVEMKDAPVKAADKKAEASRKVSSASASSTSDSVSTSDSSTTTSDSDADDEKEPEKARCPSPKPNSNNLKRKSPSSESSSNVSSDDSNSESLQTAGSSSIKAKKPKLSVPGAAKKEKKVCTSSDPKVQAVAVSSPNSYVAIINEAKKTAASSSSSSSSDSSPASSDSGSDVAPAKIPLPASSSSATDTSSSSESEEEPPASKATQVTTPPEEELKLRQTSTDSSVTVEATSPVKVVQNVSPSSSVSSSDVSSTSSSDSEASTKPTTLIPVPVVSKRKRSPSPLSNSSTPAMTTSSTLDKRQKKNQNIPFSRIPVDTQVDARVSSNAYVPYDYAERAHRDLIVTKGKGFTKEKNKKKKGSYRGGMIDVDGRKGIKFQD